jgi:bifunctional DNase/RNase
MATRKIRKYPKLKRVVPEVKKYKILSLVLLVVVFFFVFYYFMPVFTQMPNVDELSTRGFVQVTVSAKTGDSYGSVKLLGDCYEVEAVVENDQAVSIESGLAGVVGPRPNSHDLFKDVANQLNLEVSMVKITELRENSYFSKIIMHQGTTILSMDARPSDAVAIAIRMDAPIYMNKTLLEEVGDEVC